MRGRNIRLRRAVNRMKAIGVRPSPISRKPDGGDDYVSVTMRAKVMSGSFAGRAYGDASRSISATTARCWA
jgi:hypothetical protein